MEIKQLGQTAIEYYSVKKIPNGISFPLTQNCVVFFLFLVSE